MILKRLALLVAGIVVVLSVAAPAGSFALFEGGKNEACQGLSVNGTSSDQCANGAKTVDSVLKVIIDVFSAIVGIIAVIMIIVAGLKFMTAGGDSSAVAAARSTLLYAIIGLAVAVLAQVIAHFVIAKGSTAANNTAQTGMTPAPARSTLYEVT